MPTTVCLVSEGPGETHLANRLHEEFGLDLAIVTATDPLRAQILRKYRAAGLAGVVSAGRERLDRMRRRHALMAAYDRWLGDRWRSLDRGIPVLRISSVNDPLVAARVAELGDVDLVVHATSIVGDEWLAACRTALNVHWGLSPYYRGVRCTEWALLHWDACNIGVTVHELRRELDGGPIVGQARAALDADDTVASINAQLSALGTEIALEALRILRAGGELERTHQDLTRGHLTFKRQWSGYLSRHVAMLERRGLGAIVSTPSRGELPITELRRRVV